MLGVPCVIMNRVNINCYLCRFVVQKLLASCPNNAMTFDEETNKAHYDMFLKCGQEISEMRGDEHSQ